MKIRKIYPRLILVCSSLLYLTACTTPGKDMIPQGGEMTMAAIYQQETAQGTSVAMALRGDTDDNSNDSLRQPTIARHVLPTTHYRAYTETAKNQIDNVFKPLPNPEIPLYIYPHLVQLNGESLPKPGLTTAFFLYPRNHFALPNEVY